MKNLEENARVHLAALADYLGATREAILANWRSRSESDPEWASSSHLKSYQFVDHIPHVLEVLGERLRAWPAEVPATRQDEQAAALHAKHRWQQGYGLRSLARELGHLNSCLVQAVDDFGARSPQAQIEALPVARQILSRHMNESVTQSIVEYQTLLESEAVTRLRELEAALVDLRELEQSRGEVLRTAAHDIKGSLSIVSGSAALLHDTDLNENERTDMRDMLQRGVSSLSGMLSDLMDMARLEAGEEKRRIEPFDAGQMLADLCATSQPLAQARGLELRTEGAGELSVEGDAAKIGRIAQNLLLNALKYTQRGEVLVAWGEHDEKQWFLRIQDTGPGLQRGGTAGPLADKIEQATDVARDVAITVADQASIRSKTGADATPDSSPDSSHDAPAVASSAGEGIGLSIVKRLCELLDATLEMETEASVGTTFRVLFPRHYAQK